MLPWGRRRRCCPARASCWKMWTKRASVLAAVRPFATHLRATASRPNPSRRTPFCSAGGTPRPRQRRVSSRVPTSRAIRGTASRQPTYESSVGSDSRVASPHAPVLKEPSAASSGCRPPRRRVADL